MAAPDIAYDALLTLTTAPIGTVVGSGAQRWRLDVRTGTIPGVITVTCTRVVGGAVGTAVIRTDDAGHAHVKEITVTGEVGRRFRWRPSDNWFEV